MRRLRWSAGALGAALVLLTVAGCGGPRGFYESGPPRVPPGGDFSLQPGGEAVVYGVRARRCGMAPPSFETALGEMFAGEGSQAPAVGDVYDAGIGQRNSVPCGGSVPVRAIGWRAPEGFEGEVTMVFYGVDQANVTVARPPEPEPEPAEAAEEPAPPAEPAAPAPQAAPEPEPVAPAAQAAPTPPEVQAAPVPQVDTEALEVEENKPMEGPQADESPVRDEEVGPPADAIRGRELVN